MVLADTITRIQEKTFKEIEQIAKESRGEFSLVVNELLEKATRMQRCPGIIFSERTTGCRAQIAGTGIEVWEVVAAYKSANEDINRLCNAYHWLTEQQIRRQSRTVYYKLSCFWTSYKTSFHCLPY